MPLSPDRWRGLVADLLIIGGCVVVLVGAALGLVPDHRVEAVVSITVPVLALYLFFTRVL